MGQPAGGGFPRRAARPWVRGTCERRSYESPTQYPRFAGNPRYGVHRGGLRLRAGGYHLRHGAGDEEGSGGWPPGFAIHPTWLPMELGQQEYTTVPSPLPYLGSATAR